MRYTSELKSELPLQTLLTEVKTILHKEGDLNKEKENLSEILEKVDFILGKYDDLYEVFTEVPISMGQSDFSKKLPYYESGDNFINFIVNGINILNEEFQENAIRRTILTSLVSSLALKDVIVVITNADGFIYHITPGSTILTDFNDKILTGQAVHVLFNNFTGIEERIETEGSIKDIKADLKWKGIIYPVKVDVTICNTLGRIESVIYIIRFC